MAPGFHGPEGDQALHLLFQIRGGEIQVHPVLPWRGSATRWNPNRGPDSCTTITNSPGATALTGASRTRDHHCARASGSRQSNVIISTANVVMAARLGQPGDRKARNAAA